MAESVVTFLLDKIVPLLEEEVKLLRGVRGEVKFITDELESMRAFLRDADARQESDEGMKAWVKQVREVAYDTEDIIDEFMLRLAQQTQRHGFVSFLHKITCFFMNSKERHQLASGIQDIKVRVRDISERSQRYRINIQEQGSSSNPKRYTWHDLRGDALLLEEAEIVGIDKPREVLIRWLLEGESRLAVVSVVGMGGLGKTTLVKKVYDDQKVNRYFEHHAWVTVSQSYKIEELLRDMIAQVFGEINQQVPPGVETMKDIRLKEILKDFLVQKRYVIVFDDIWRIHAWDAIKYALPDSKCGGRIIVTTRFADIASSCKQSNGYVYNLQPLLPQDSWTLFCKKAFQLNLENSCPPELEKLSRSILKKCDGLPLAIVTIGCLLSTKYMNLIEWQTIQCGLELENNDRLKSMRRVLMYSFNDLPYYLKACFMYLSIFPEDCLINRNRLIRLWIAEGFVEEKEGWTVEEVAERYFYELINRSLIQVAEMDVCGRVKRCQVHDLMHDFILSKSREDHFSEVVVDENIKILEKIRRLSIHNSDENVAQSYSFSSLRSLFLFGRVKLSDTFFSGGFRLLKVVDLKGVPMEIFPKEIVNLFHLRYLSMKKTNIKMLPNSIGKLQNLETLDLKYTYISEMPVGILKLQKLRHLLVHDATPGKQGFKPFVGIGGLRFLQKLYFIQANQDSDIIRELGRLSQLRRLGIGNLRKEDGIFLCSSIEKMSNLRSFKVSSINDEEILDLQTLSPVPSLLQRLYMKGRLEKLPCWISSLQNLNIIYFGASRLREDPLEALQALPNLMELRLREAYDGEVLCFKAGGFQRLKILIVRDFKGLRLIRVEEGAMPLLQGLEIIRCGLLEKVPLGIERLANLKELRFVEMPDELRIQLLPDQGGEEHWRVAHIPNVWYYLRGDKGWIYNRLVETDSDSMPQGRLHKTKGPQ